MHTLENKVAIVTGGACGIGAEIVKEFLKEHVKYVAIIDINDSKGWVLEKQLKLKYGDETVHFFNCDVTDDEQLFDILKKIMEKYETIDVVVNNAAIACEDGKVYKKSIEINFTALVTSSLKALEIMRADEGGKGGTIINVSSIEAIILRSPSIFVYSATKSAVLHFSTCLGMEEYFKHTNVRVLTVCFGGTDTEILHDVKGIDKLTSDTFNGLVEFSAKKDLLQTAEIAAQGLVHSFKTGKSGSSWLVESGNIVNITDDVRDAYKLMSKHILA